MRPWPVELQRMFPRNDGMRPDRPWWHQPYDGFTFYRTDGLRTTPGDYCNLTVAEHIAAQDRLDAEKPIPHPGFRVGQIWAIPLANNPRYYVVGSNDRQLESGFYLDTLDAATIEGDTGKVFFDWASTEGNRTEESCLHLWLKGAFLVHDPVCPWLAPWAPPAD